MYGSLDLDCDCSNTGVFEAVAARLPADAIWVTSQLKRTRQTADALIAAGAAASTWIEDAAISEMDFGEFNGKTHAELLAQRTDPWIGFWPISPHEIAPGGESFDGLSERVGDFVDRMHNQHTGRDIVCVAHRGTILAALRQALMLPLQTSVAFTIDNVSLTQLYRFDTVPANGPQFRVPVVGWLP